MEEVKETIINTSKIYTNLVEIKNKLNSNLLSDDESTITEINKEMTEVLNDLNSFLIKISNEYKELNQQ